MSAARHRSNDDRSSEASSVRSSASGNDSLPGSASSSPCESPQPSSSSKWGGDGDPGASSLHPCRYFVMKAANLKIVQAAEQRGTWGATSASEKKIAAAIAVCCLSLCKWFFCVFCGFSVSPSLLFSDK